MITVTDLSDNQFTVDVPLIASIFQRGQYTEIHLKTRETIYVQESVGYIIKLVFRERGDRK